MTRIFTLIATVIIFMTANAASFSYRFKSTPLPNAIRQIMEEHPELDINFIYNELENYTTSSTIKADNAYDALRQLIALNPVTVTGSNDTYYIEALQHGKYVYVGNVIGNDKKPVVAATVLLLTPKDSTVLTYGMTDDYGHFTIPCDRQPVIAKISSIGYKTVYKKFTTFNVGTVLMNELPIKLRNVSVEGDNAFLLSDRNIYRPTQRQKNASQTATDLLVRMSIPQLDTRLGSSSVSTASGQPVAIFIDFVPATETDLKMMKVTDVKTVEYLEYPSDPRFQGNRYVINFRMIKYEYGGYVKALGVENFIVNSGFAQANARFVRRKMTYDLMGYGYYTSNNHFGVDQKEMFHLPQENGEIKSFLRETTTESSKYRKHNYETSFRALYSGDKITANSQIAFGINKIPHSDEEGRVEYSDEIMENGEFVSESSQNAKYLKYNGYYFFSLPKNSSFSVSLGYSYSHTDQSSNYVETRMASIYNSADDNTQEGDFFLTFNRSFSNKHSFMAHVRGLYEHNRTNYYGSVNALDNSATKFGQIGASYSFSAAAVSASFGVGWDWLSTYLNDNKSYSNYPYIDASLRYVPNKKNSFGAVFHYSVWPPSSNYKSENIIHVSPFLWHTGNPVLKSSRCYDIWLNYSFIPSNKFNMNVFAGTYFLGDRAAFVYEATPYGIVRTIQQPIGRFQHYNYGVNVSTNFFNKSLYLSGKVAQLYVRNGKPYNINHTCLSYYMQALYYLGNFNFALTYQSADATDNYDSMSGVWTRSKDVFVFQVGWSNRKWNIKMSAQNLQRWNWQASHDVMSSPNYSVDKWISNASRHAFVQLSATYTFGFGKKVSRRDDISRQSGASSGILK
ncbi:MAG: outer membrane beta-barrel family protein [Muribaculaceae bacterium]|nr:outer membrane beta-barrel family protein [Muribaculaceae bacterium]